MSELGTVERPLRVAIVGSGPSGFYAAEALFKSDKTVQVDVYDRLPTPFGLVRGGVAPDHQKIKNVVKVYEKIAGSDGFRFFGNVHVGRDVHVDELRQFYDAVLLAFGAETDNRLDIPGEDLPGSHTATEFVGWYNGHPDFRNHTFDLSCEVAVIVGQGNVAMDVSRVLAKTPDELRATDIAAHALEALAESKVREIHLVGRRGPAQAKFTTPEIREIGELEDCDPIVRPEDLELDPESQKELEMPENHTQHKNYEVLQEFAHRGATGKNKKYFIHFLRSPKEIQGDGKVERTILEKNQLSGEAGNMKARGTGETETLPCGIFFRSVGYRGIAMPTVPFDERRGVIPNKRGRVTDNDLIVPGLYVAGWIKRGPSGVIGTNKPDSVETVEALLEDLAGLEPCQTPDSGAAQEFLAAKGVRVIDFEDWKKIDAAELERGKAIGKPREKFTTIEEMLALLQK